MKMIRRLMVLFACAFATGVQATPVTVTIDVPQLSWVTPSAMVVTPLAAYNGNVTYLAGDGVLWAMWPALAQPYVDGFQPGPNDFSYESADCTSAPLLVSTIHAPGMAIVSKPGFGPLFYAIGTDVSASVTIRAHGNGLGCYSDTPPPAGTPVWTLVGPLTPPTLPAGPYHIELR